MEPGLQPREAVLPQQARQSEARPAKSEFETIKSGLQKFCGAQQEALGPRLFNDLLILAGRPETQGQESNEYRRTIQSMIETGVGDKAKAASLVDELEGDIGPVVEVSNRVEDGMPS